MQNHSHNKKLIPQEQQQGKTFLLALRQEIGKFEQNRGYQQNPTIPPGHPPNNYHNQNNGNFGNIPPPPITLNNTSGQGQGGRGNGCGRGNGDGRGHDGGRGADGQKNGEN